MKQLFLKKAESLPHQEIEDVQIVIESSDAISFNSDVNVDLNTAREFFKTQGRQLADVLYKSLPGGTLDQLLCELMTRRASLFIVPLFK